MKPARDVGRASTWLIVRPEGRTFGWIEVGFLDDMSLHHQGAITLSFAYLETRGNGPMGHYAREIVTDQSQEIGLMNGLLANATNLPPRDEDAVMEWMGTPTPLAAMPGMATSQDYAQLRASTGLRTDDLFSELVIRHHAAGIAMADHASAHGHDPTVRRLASTMARVQRQEIAQLDTRRQSLGLAAVEVDTTAASHEHR